VAELALKIEATASGHDDLDELARKLDEVESLPEEK
jgi:hypothetical protein